MKTDRSEWLFPRDWIILLTVPAIATISAYLFPAVSHALQVSQTLFLIALALIVAGIIFRFIARSLLDRQGQHLSARPKDPPAKFHRIANVCIILGLIITLMLLVIPKQKAIDIKKGEPTAAAAASRGQ